MNAKQIRLLMWFMAIVLILLVACSSGTPEPTEAPVVTESPEPQATEEVEPPPERNHRGWASHQNTIKLYQAQICRNIECSRRCRSL